MGEALAVLGDDPLRLGLAALALLLGGLVKGATGAGAPVVAVPILTALYSVELAVVVFVMPNLVTNLWQAWQFRSDRPNGIALGHFALAGGLGAAAGSWLLATVPAQALLGTSAVVVAVYITFRLTRPGWRLAKQAAARFAWPAGLAGGALQGAVGISAPVSISFLNAIGLPRPQFVAGISTFFTVMSAIQLVALYGLSLLDAPRLMLGVIALVPLFLGMPLGDRLGRRVPAWVFDRFVLALLAVVALRLAWQALG